MKTCSNNLSANDPLDPIELLRERWKTARNDLRFCCDVLKQQVLTGCNAHGFDCPDYLIRIGITGIDTPRAFWCGAAGNATYEICFCPWCGSKLPSLTGIVETSSVSNSAKVSANDASDDLNEDTMKQARLEHELSKYLDETFPEETSPDSIQKARIESELHKYLDDTIN